MDFVNIDKNLPNGDNMGGVAQTVIFGLWDDVATWPAAPAAPEDVEDNGVWVGDIVMKAGKSAFTFYSTHETGEFTCNPVGSVDGISFEQKLTVFNPGLKQKLLGFLGAVKNENLFFIVQDQEGQYFLMGDSLRAAKMVAEGGVGTGKAIADRKGATLTFTHPTNCPRVYTGDVSGILDVASA